MYVKDYLVLSEPKLQVQGEWLELESWRNRKVWRLSHVDRWATGHCNKGHAFIRTIRQDLSKTLDFERLVNNKFSAHGSGIWWKIKMTNQNVWNMCHGQMRNTKGGRLGKKEKEISPHEKQHDNRPGQQEIMNKLQKLNPSSSCISTWKF